jgi:GT2 family glycosyltransferase
VPQRGRGNRPRVRRVAEQLARHDAELLFVDDGSDDGTLELIKAFAARDPRVSYISFTRNFGLEAAIAAGFRYVCAGRAPHRLGAGRRGAGRASGARSRASPPAKARP